MESSQPGMMGWRGNPRLTRYFISRFCRTTMMKRTLLVWVLAGVVCAGSSHAASTTYMGILTGPGGGGDGQLVFTKKNVGVGWESSGTSLSWRVENTAPGMWRYEYRILVPNLTGNWGNIQTVIIETSPTFDLSSPNVAPGDWSHPIGQYEPLPLSPTIDFGLPDDIYGIRFFTETLGVTDLTISFETPHAPMWGDVYVASFHTGTVCSTEQFNTFHNAGFRWMSDTDPVDPPSNGSIGHHVLVPGLVGIIPPEPPITPVIPAPGAILLGATGTSLTGWFWRKRWL